jgi:Domain of unknown function (DUF4375)
MDIEGASELNKKPDIEALLSAADTQNVIIELDNYICELCSWGDDLDRLTEPQKFFYFNQSLEREVNNGGFKLYFLNSSGDNAQETVASLQAIRADKTAAILRSAIGQFPNSAVPTDREERQTVLIQIEETANDMWGNLDQKFYAYEDDLNELNLKYVKQHRSSFE